MADRTYKKGGGWCNACRRPKTEEFHTRNAVIPIGGSRWSCRQVAVEDERGRAIFVHEDRTLPGGDLYKSSQPA